MDDYKTLTLLDYFSNKARMTENCTIHCDDCGFSGVNNGKNKTCSAFEVIFPKEAIKIVMDWAKENPIKTRQSELLKLCPATPLNSGVIDICTRWFDKSVTCLSVMKNKSSDDYCLTCKKEFWLEEIE